MSDRREGKVYLVGAGPGDPRLITVRGRQVLGFATVVLYDGLVDPRLLKWAPQAQHVCVGKHGRSKIWTQEEICQRMVAEAMAGHVVVRLKGGDPALFARTAEELDALVAAGIEFEVVPGVTAGLAAGSYSGIPITDRARASAVAFVTGHQYQQGGQQRPVDWATLAKFPGTLVVYMGVTTAPDWSRQLIQGGMSPQTPVVIVRHCTWPDQQTLRCSLEEVGRLLGPDGILRPPAVVVVGKVAEVDPRWNWYDRLPLRGCGVLVSRPRPQGEELARRLEELGAATWVQPAIELTVAEDMSPVARLLKQMAGARGGTNCDLPPAGEPSSRSEQGGTNQPLGITFSSPNSVEFFWRYAYDSGYDARIASQCCLAVVGPATDEALRRFGLRADVLPREEDGFSAAGLLKRLVELTEINHWVVTSSNESRDTLAAGLRQAGKRVTVLETYHSRPVQQLDAAVVAALHAGQIRLCTVTSSAIARSLHSLLGDFVQQVAPVSFSPAITSQLSELGWQPASEAKTQTLDALTEACLEAARTIGPSGK
ncbi:MAG: uroporphyrinogen III methyltransferase [Pirellulaceae bacterium]|nr:MAG: uroporphyrinogen III methyltransferase [Pirellulaceae bacterium]